MNRFFSILFVVILLQATQHAEAMCDVDATYKLTFNYKWSSMYFKDVPAGAHFSPLIAFSHKGRYPTFTKYGVASPGFRSVAETGSTSTLRDELRMGQMKMQVGDVQVDSAIPDGDGMASVMLKVNCSFPFISAVTMVAPSPDWVVPCFRQSVLKIKSEKSMKYRKKITGNLMVWDAGTDSGMKFTSPDMPSDPIQNIAPFYGEPFEGKYIGEFTLIKMNKNEMDIMN